MLISDTTTRVRLVRPGGPGWDEARGTFNLLTDQRPEAIAFPTDEREVAAVVACARERGLRVAPQATGHNAAPLGSLEGTLILNTSALTGISIDATARRVRVGAATRCARARAVLGAARRRRELRRGDGDRVRGRAGPRAAVAAARARPAAGHVRDAAAGRPRRAGDGPREPLPYRSAHALVDALSAPAIDDIARIAAPGSSVVLVQLRHMGGALARHAPRAGARATLPGRICMLAIAVPEPGAEPAARAELDALSAAVGAYGAGVYPNFVEEPADASGFFDPETWERLRQVKALYDPQDVFRANHQIAPAVAA